MLQVGAVLAPLAGGRVPANPYRPPPEPREPTEAEREHDSRKAWRMLDAWMEQSFGG